MTCLIQSFIVEQVKYFVFAMYVDVRSTVQDAHRLFHTFSNLSHNLSRCSHPTRYF